MSPIHAEQGSEERGVVWRRRRVTEAPMSRRRAVTGADASGHRL